MAVADAEGACPLCGEAGVDGGHVLRCPLMGEAAAGARRKVEAALAEAAAAAPAVGQATPASAEAEAWLEAARAAGAGGAVHALGGPPEETTDVSACAWAAAGWRRSDEERRLTVDAEGVDAALVAWAAWAVRRANAAVTEAVTREVEEHAEKMSAMQERCEEEGQAAKERMQAAMQSLEDDFASVAILGVQSP